MKNASRAGIKKRPIHEIVRGWNDGIFCRGEVGSMLAEHSREAVNRVALPKDIRDRALKIIDAIEAGEPVIVLYGGTGRSNV